MNDILDDDCIRHTLRHLSLAECLRFENVATRWSHLMFDHHMQLSADVVRFVASPTHSTLAQLNYVLCLIGHCLKIVWIHPTLFKKLVSTTYCTDELPTFDANIAQLLTLRAPNLCGLKLFDVQLTPDALEMIGNLHRLQTLEIVRCKRVSSLDVFCDCSNDCPLAQNDTNGKIHVSTFEIALRSALIALQGLRRFWIFQEFLHSNLSFLEFITPKLNRLKIKTYGFRPNGVEECFLRFLQTHAALKELYICANWLLRDNLVHSWPLLELVLAQCPNLTRLEFSGYINGLRLPNLSAFRNLLSLQLPSTGLSGQKLSDADIVQLCRQNPDLDKLYLLDCISKDFTGRSFIDGLAILSTLENFIIFPKMGRFLTDNAFEAIIRSNAMSFRTVFLSDTCLLSPSSLCSLAAVCPRLEFVMINQYRDCPRLGMMPITEPACLELFFHSLTHSDTWSSKRRLELRICVYVPERLINMASFSAFKLLPQNIQLRYETCLPNWKVLFESHSSWKYSLL